jgi:SPP1 family predicted phage head-tail adaptor
MSDPGRLKDRLLLEAPVELPDGSGGVTRGYATTATVWAALTPVASRGSVAADAVAATVTHQIVIRRGPEVTTRHRFRLGTRVFRVIAMRDDDPERRFLAIQAEERTD